MNTNDLDIRHEADETSAAFPALLVEAERIAQTVAAGFHGRRRAGPGETFWQHRPYAFGDPVSAIDWRQSARVADRLYIRQNEWEAAASVYLWRDPSDSLDYASSRDVPLKRRRADVLAVALAILLSRAGERVSLLGQGRRAFQGRTAPARILEGLGVTRAANDDLPADEELPRGARIVMLSDFFMDASSIDAAVKKFAGAGAKGVLVQICDPSEERFPFAGHTEFEDLESPDRALFGDASAVRKDYRTIFDAHRDQLRTIAGQQDWTYIYHSTENPAQAALLSLYTAIGDHRLWKA